MRTETAFFVGKPDRWDELLLLTLHRQHCRVQVIHNDVAAYRNIEIAPGNMLLFSMHHQNTATLRLFYHLRSLERLCGVLCYTDAIRAFLGKNHVYRCSFPKNTEGATGLLRWKRDTCDRMMDEAELLMQPIEVLSANSVQIPNHTTKRAFSLHNLVDL